MRTGKKVIRISFEKMVKFQNRKRLAFKITGPGRICYLHSIFSDATFVEIQREPYATIRSLMEVEFWSNKNKTLFWKGAYTAEEIEIANQYLNNPCLVAAIQYKKIRETIQMEAKNCNANYYSLSYEEFVAQPRAFIKKLLTVLKLKESRAIDRYLLLNKIHNRNKDSAAYFSEETRKKMLKLL